MPSQKQLRWSQLRVGLTVIFASIVLAVLIFLMSGTVGIFSHKLVLFAYFEDAGGLRVGAPVRLEGVDIGNISAITLVPRNQQPPPQKTTPAADLADLAQAAGKSAPPVLDKPVQVKITVGEKNAFLLRKDSIASLDTAGVLGETFVNIDSTLATGPNVQDRDVLLTHKSNSVAGMVSASQTTIQNMDVLIRRADRILTSVEKGEGSLGLFINDKRLYQQLNATLAQVQGLVADIANGKGSLGLLISSRETYDKLNASIDKLNKIADDIQAGKGTVGRLMQDPSLYNRANEAVGKINTTLDSVNSGKGAVGKILNDEQFAKKLDDTLTRLQSIMDKIDTGQGAAGKLINDSALYDNLNNTVTEMRNLLAAIRQNPKKYLTIHLKIF